MKNRYIISLCLALMSVPFPVFASSVVINEIAWMGSPPKNGETSSAAANNEWIELKNTGFASVDIAGWSLLAEDGTPNIMLTGNIPAGGFLLLERTNDDTVPGITADIIYTGALSNSGEKLILKDGQGNIVDTVDASAGWSAGSAETKDTMQKGEGWITALGTPRAENVASGPPLSSPTPSATPTPSVTSSRSPTPGAESPSASASAPMTTSHGSLIKTIKAYAGEDIFSMVGVMFNFLGRAKGLNDESLDSSARFFWNFGDGETKEGRSVSHSYRMPGSYVAGLHVSSGEYAASDYVRIQINPNLVSISSVILGTDGYVRLKNASDIEVDVSGWNMRDNAGHTFILPLHTILGRRADAAIMNSVTALLGTASSLPLTVFYPNGVFAFSYFGTSTFAARVEAISVLTPELVQTKEKEKDLSPHLPAVAATINLHSSLSPTPTIASSSNTGEHQYATASSSSFAFPFGAAIGISILGAAGFLISKRFS